MKWLFAYSARKLAHTAQDAVSSELEQIINGAINQINTDSRRGHFSTSVYVPKEHRKQFKHQLNKMGFKIKNFEHFVEISWADDTLWDMLEKILSFGILGK